MTGAEKGFLLLSSQLGNPDRKVLTVPQLRLLGQRVRQMIVDAPDRDLTESDLRALGYNEEMARRIVALLEDEALLTYYLNQGTHRGCLCLSRISGGYPAALRERLGDDSPGCLWAKGDLSLLALPKISLVGSRDLEAQNRNFAEEVGRQAAAQGFVLVSGNARGADKAAQDACLRAGGKVISVVADALTDHGMRKNVLYLSEDGFDCAFSAQRAISRNRLIHALAEMTFVAQSSLYRGGTWDGTSKNLRHGWSPVYLFCDGSAAMAELAQMGGELISQAQLLNFETLPRPLPGFLED